MGEVGGESYRQCVCANGWMGCIGGWGAWVCGWICAAPVEINRPSGLGKRIACRRCILGCSVYADGVWGGYDE